MRFIVEFKLSDKDKEFKDWEKYLIERQKNSRQLDMGNMLAESFGWQNPVLGDPLRHRLEIEAFPMDKWVEFKQKVVTLFVNDSYAGDGFSEIKDLIKELESFGKPAGSKRTIK
jgi:hypothetical protein